jgi:hypothetical protein
MKQEHQIILQSLSSISLVDGFYSIKNWKTELNKLFPTIRDEVFPKFPLNQGPPGQGLVVLFFYTIFLLPKENKIFTNDDEKKVEDLLIRAQKSFNASTKDPKQTKYCQHIRNSIAHSRIEFHQEKGKEDEGVIIFNDKFNWQLTLYLTKITEIIPEIMKILGNRIIPQGNEQDA